MTLATLTLQNLVRNPLRSWLTVLAFALPSAVLVAAIALGLAMQNFSATTQRELRLGVFHKVTRLMLLPAGMRRRIEALDPQGERLTAVCAMRWFGGRVPGQPNTLISVAADVDTFPVVYHELEITPQEADLWQRERRAAMAGRDLARQYGWQAGARIELESTVPPYLRLEFLLVKIIERQERSSFFYMRRDYLTESLAAAQQPEPDGVNIFWVKCRSLDDLQALGREIDAMNARSLYQTRSEDESAMLSSALQTMGDLPGLLQAMGLVVVAILALVEGNAMMMSFRERTRELAVMKAIGFPSGSVFRVVLAESMVLALAGGAAGVIPAAILLTWLPVTNLTIGPLGSIVVTPEAVAGALLLTLAIGVVAGLWPAWQAVRLHVVDSLRRVA